MNICSECGLPKCPECGTEVWSQWFSFSGTELEKLAPTIDGKVESTTEPGRYDGEGDGWECQNGHLADDDISEKLDELRSEAA